MADTFNKKALQQKRAKKKLDKLDKREERKLNNDKGKSLEEMIVYLDENGNITNVHPDKQKKKKVITTNNNSSNFEENVTYEGIISLYFDEKGYGFITEAQTSETIFLHVNKMKETLKEKDKVVYEIEQTQKGYAAINVRKQK